MIESSATREAKVTRVAAELAGRKLVSPALVAVTRHVPRLELLTLYGAVVLTAQPVAEPLVTV